MQFAADVPRLRRNRAKILASGFEINETGQASFVLLGIGCGQAETSPEEQENGPLLGLTLLVTFQPTSMSPGAGSRVLWRRCQHALDPLARRPHPVFRVDTHPNLGGSLGVAGIREQFPQFLAASGGGVAAERDHRPKSPASL